MATLFPYYMTLLLTGNTSMSRMQREVTQGAPIHSSSSKETLTQQLGEKLRRIFVERGIDFFEKGKGRPSGKTGTLAQDMDIDPHEDPGEEKITTATMTTEDLLKMRMEILPHLQQVQEVLCYV